MNVKYLVLTFEIKSMTTGFLEKILIGAGEILRAGFGVATRIKTKQDQSNIVTDSDFKSEEYLRSMIRSAYPTHNVLGEEHGFENHSSDYTWIIDPLDGTSNFAAQIPWFGILVALVKDGKPILSGAYLPISNEMYLAEAGVGTLKNGKIMTVTSENNLKNLLCCYSLDFSKNTDKTEKEVRIIKNLVNSSRNIRSTNSIVDFCLVADGRIGAAINQTMKIWDVAAPQLIIEEAGGKVTDIDGHKIVYEPSEASTDKNFTAVAASKVIHSTVMKLIYN